jgi:ABC-type transporter Mla maintaining outer membrane lipid asymmetry ATPase subunit MlaF
MSALLEVSALRARRGDREVLHGVSFQVPAGQLCALMGVSGAGKSTVLRAIAALTPFDAGEIAVGDARLRAGPLPPGAALRELRRRVGIVFQSRALFEHLTARGGTIASPLQEVGEGIKVAVVSDPFGNPVGLIENPHFGKG